jgi:hypothetical protein
MAENFLKIRNGVSLGNLSSAPSLPVNGDMYYNGTANKFKLYENGAWVEIGGSGGGYTTSIKTTTYTAVDKDEIFADSSGGAFTIDLPASPSIGNRVKVVDYGSSWSTNSVTIGRNGSNINGTAADFTLNLSDSWVEFIFVDTTKGWRVVS